LPANGEDWKLLPGLGLREKTGLILLVWLERLARMASG
jgi:hypothetical protein